jgi:hypothetical protein
VIIDPYARSILSRRRYGELGAQLDYESDDVLGLAATWPQAAAFLPKPTVSCILIGGGGAGILGERAQGE